MKVSYMAIGYACNQKCRFCPCSGEETSYPLISLADLKAALDRMLEQEPIGQLVVSGGEPTLYPYFAEFIRHVLDKGLQVTILSNSERFADRSFTERFCEICRPEGRLQVITTIHSQNTEEHERVNRTKGSFARTSQGLRNLCECGVHVTVKHCITKLNYRDLTKFYRFVDGAFSPAVDIQLCSIDYCGLTDQDKQEHEVIFPVLEPYFEELFDAYMEDLGKGSDRHMYCINMPLCSADPYYWEFFRFRSDGYTSYAAPQAQGEECVDDTVESITGTFGDVCKDCVVQEICPGTYRTAFEYFGDEIVSPYPVTEEDG